MARYLSVRPEELLLTTAVDDALRVFSIPSSRSRTGILICEPTFPMYRYYAEIYGARISVLRYGSEMEFPSRASSLRCVRSRVFSSSPNPNNPTGTLLQKRSCGES